MKEKYFTSESSLEVSKAILSEVHTVTRRREIDLLLSETALLVLDMQHYFFDESSHAFIPSMKGIIENIRNLEGLFSDSHRLIILTRHLNTPEDAGLMKIWWNGLVEKENVSSRLIEEIAVPDSIIIDKTKYDAFFDTDLEEILKNNNIKNLIICGVMTHLCCETTARSGFMHGFNIFFTVDGTATYNKKFHLSTILNLSHGFAIPVLIPELIEYILKRGSNE
ncbi:cysteine hydrolase [Candidatus Dependentiae bacterium]|nr:cysteine hydrolase [Candidatus Dependentiae bacterium]